jgi:Regulator of volume decrease after cellular swelling
MPMMTTLVQTTNPDQFPRVILLGASAQLSALRRQQVDDDDDNNSADRWRQSVFFRERHAAATAEEDPEDDDSFLLLDTSLPVTLYRSEISDNKNEEEDDEDNTATVMGRVFVSKWQLLFVANDPSDIEYDIAVGASCILLHAMMEDPQLAVYIQLDNNCKCDDNELTEITLIPTQAEEDCQRLFDALCRLVALHPDQDEDDEGEDGNENGGMFGMGHDDLIWAPSPGVGIVEDEDDDIDGGATEEERNVMLERLDNLLVVRPDMDTQDDQFEDASEDGENGRDES